MKKLNILLLSVVAMGSTFVSCTKENANPTKEENIETPSEFTLTGKWNFLTVSEANEDPIEHPAGWGVAETQCEDRSDYIEFKSSSSVVYGNADTKNSTNCTVEAVSMSYTTAATELSKKVVIKNVAGSGQTSTFYLVKNTETEMNLRTIVQGKTWTYVLTKAQE